MMNIMELMIIGQCLLGMLAFIGWYKYIRTKANFDANKAATEKLQETFGHLSAQALKHNNEAFLDLAQNVLGNYQEKAKDTLEQKEKAIDELVKPVHESLKALDQEMRNLEKERKGDHATVKTQIESLLKTEKALQSETANLVKALRAPVVRGRWGELQLRRVIELSGMINHCDFFEQTSQSSEDGVIRPDVIIQLPGDKQVIIDAKAPMEAYLDAQETDDEEKKKVKLQTHARQVRAHLNQLGKKAYWQRYASSPEFVVLFLPSETFFSAALEQDPTLIEGGANQGVILATPTTLIGLLRAVAYGWKQEAISKNAQAISDLGHELYKRINDMATHFGKVGKALSQSVDAYNKAIGSLERRVLTSARKFQEFGVSSKEIELEPIEFIEKTTRTVSSTADQNQLPCDVLDDI